MKSVALLRLAEVDDQRETNVTGTYPPLALAYLAATARRAGYRPVVIDGEAPLRPLSKVMSEIPNDVLLIGVSTTTLAWPAVRKAATALKARFPEAAIIVGGPHVTAFPEETLEFSDFDVGVIGDGEHAFVELLSRADSGRSLAGVPGTVYRENNVICVDRQVRWVERLDDLPLPALDLLPLHRYRSVVVRDPFVTMLTSRGCPYKCSFCSQIYMGEKFRFHSAQRILAEMDRAVRAFGAQEVVMFDETFGANRKVARDVFEEMQRRRFGFRWNARTRIDILDEALLKAMWQSGCYMLHLGIESGSQRILDKMHKGIDLGQVERIVDIAHRIGFQLHGYFMLGYPGESREEIEATVKLSRRLPLNWASYTITIPNPKTLLQEQAVEEGLLSPDFWSDYVAGRNDGTIPFLSSPECPVEYLTAVKRNAYLRFYLRPQTLARQSAFVLRSGGVGRLAEAGMLWLRELT